MCMLQRIGCSSIKLPLFSNIPVAGSSIKNRSHTESLDEIRLILFGSIHHGADVAGLAKEAAAFSKKHAVTIKLQLVGRNGIEKGTWQQIWQSEGLPLELLGEKSFSEISALFGKASFGISTTPGALVEKSGSVAAMLEHGLPVLCISRPWHPRGFNNLQLPEGVKEYQPGKLEDVFLNTSISSQQNNISTVTKQFVDNLYRIN